MKIWPFKFKKGICKMLKEKLMQDFKDAMREKDELKKNGIPVRV